MMIVDDLPMRPVRKVASSEAERVRLGREYRILEALPHHGVVRLIGQWPAPDDSAAPPSSTTCSTEMDEIRTAWVEGGTLADRAGLCLEEVAGIGVSLATTVADIHDLGFAHCGLTRSTSCSTGPEVPCSVASVTPLHSRSCRVPTPPPSDGPTFSASQTPS